MDEQLRFLAPVLKPNLVFTKAQAVQQVRDCMDGIGDGLGTAIGFDPAGAGVNGNQFRLKSARICRIVEVLYDYAMSGIWPDPSYVGGEEQVDDITQDLATISGTARVMAELYGYEVPVFLEKILAMSMIRGSIDRRITGHELDSTVLHDDDVQVLTLRHVAVLAQMTEKSVRNATQPKAPDRLKTVRVGSHTFVEHAEALRWLSSRRGFKPTVFPETGNTKAGRGQ